MDGQTYLAIFKENGLVRSDLVRILENQVKVFEENSMLENAEEAKWLAIEIAEEEKAQGYPFLNGNETREQIAERYLNARGKM
ncbi:MULTISPECIES: hypothetical protein [unclassified Enterococcus]|uniref:hypothetical protein n=1 Tax=unclassified Enterococcus TaxID=2608891 RepID=UPI00259B9253|nr:MULTISPECIES: hypothetical protein [unclassified Enterococcus]MDO0919868.1 hypothetical protein [Enterococcus sp. B1E2]WIV14331.1 hypothetical protein QN079_10085 [Enterococcus sp. FZMF]